MIYEVLTIQISTQLQHYRQVDLAFVELGRGDRWYPRKIISCWKQEALQENKQTKNKIEGNLMYNTRKTQTKSEQKIIGKRKNTQVPETLERKEQIPDGISQENKSRR